MAYPSKALNEFMGVPTVQPEFPKMIVLVCVDTCEHFLKGKEYRYLQTGPSRFEQALFTGTYKGVPYDFHYPQFRIDQMVADKFLKQVAPAVEAMV